MVREKKGGSSENQNMTFENAYRRLEEIFRQIQSDEMIDVEKIVALQKEAQELEKICQLILGEYGKNNF
ncbi:MAG TPA: exodeoxyribonuclease VII small subunit [Candidatus Absconditabacterales bacterium]|nr:exodeoxyribonuclease VII small subunit [Candidatus Absconditabacterales bacterium]HMT27205.1 exodeoxyribonuclease VII small subunit [Candidatus Absconditabacterales bacterium]